MGRNSKEVAKLTRTFSFKTTAEQGELWDEKIRQSAYNKSEFFRRAVEKNETIVSPSKKAIVHKPKRSIDEQKILFLLSQQSNNINQIAHRLNTDHKAGKVSQHLYADILDVLQSISDVAKNWRP